MLITLDTTAPLWEVTQRVAKLLLTGQPFCDMTTGITCIPSPHGLTDHMARIGRETFPPFAEGDAFEVAYTVARYAQRQARTTAALEIWAAAT